MPPPHYLKYRLIGKQFMRLFISRTPSSLELNDDSGPPHSYPHKRSSLHRCVFSSYF